MTISDTEKLDFLWKKVIFGTSKTASSLTKSGSNETVSSPLPVYATNVWTQSDTTSIPLIPPSSTTATVHKYYGAARIALVMDTTSPANVTWGAGMGNFIPTTFGSGYLVRVWLGDPNGAKAARIFPDTTGQEYVFDYVSGTLNFTGTIPSGITATIGSGVVGVATDSVYIEVYHYIGTTLDTSIAAIGESSKTSVVADITARDALVPNVGDIAHVLDASGDPANAGTGEFADYLWTGSAWQCIATQASARTDALTQSIPISNSNFVGDGDDLVGTVGNGTRVVEVSIEVTTVFDGSADITIGDAANNSRLLDNSEVDLQTLGVYVVYPVYQFDSAEDTDVLVYYTGSPTQGAAKITITWA
jgi:hypothetical protein